MNEEISRRLSALLSLGRGYGLLKALNKVGRTIQKLRREAQRRLVEALTDDERHEIEENLRRREGELFTRLVSYYGDARWEQVREVRETDPERAKEMARAIRSEWGV